MRPCLIALLVAWLAVGSVIYHREHAHEPGEFAITERREDHV